MRLIILISIILLPLICFASDMIKYKLIDKTPFENEIDKHYCEKIIIDGRMITWVTRLVEVGKSIVFRKCVVYKEPQEGTSTEGAIYGGVKSGWYEIKADNVHILKQLQLPKLNDFSNPSYCDSYIAYWGTDKNNTFYAMVANIDTKEVIRDYKLSNFIKETDFMYHLNPGIWASDCSAVTFKDERYIKTKELKI